MTEVFVHGRLGKEFGKCFKFSISKPRDVVAAIDSVFEGFHNRMIELARSGAHYSLIADDQVIGSVEDFVGKRKIKQVHIVPVLFGSGVAALAIGVVALIGSVAATSAGFAILGSILLAVAFTAISFGVQSLLAKPPSANSASVSGGSGQQGSTSATSKSFLFTNKENITQQGNPVPLGYGRLRIGSAVIQQTVKSYPNSLSTFNEFVSQSSQEGQGSMSIIHNQEI